MFLCFFFFNVFSYLSALDLFGQVDYLIEWLGIDYHYQSVSKGVIDTRDVLYFVSFSAVFVLLAYRIW